MEKLLCKAAAVFALPLLWFVSMGTAYGQDSRSVALYRLTHCCPQSAWTDAEYAAIKELDAMDVTVTLLDRGSDAEEGLEREIEAIGKSGNYSVLLYFFKSISKGVVGVRIAVFKKTDSNVEIKHLVYTTQPSVNALSVVTLKAVEAAREAVFGPEPVSPSPIDGVISKDEKSPENERPARVENPPQKGTPRAPGATEIQPSPKKRVEKETAEDKEDRFSDLEKAPRKKKRRVRKPRERKQRERKQVSISPHRIALGLGPGFMWSPSRVWAFSLGAVGNFRIVESLFVELNVGGTLTASGFYVYDPEHPGSGDRVFGTYRSVLFRAVLFWSFLSKKRVHPMLGIVGGGVLTFAKRTYDFDGRVEQGFSNVALLGGQGRLGIDLSNRLGLIFGIEASAYLPEIEFTFNDDSTVVIGRPLLNGFCNLEFRF